MATVTELRQQRMRLMEEARSIVDQAESENRDFTGEEQQRFDRLDGEIESLTSRANRQERQEQRDRDLADAPPDYPGAPGSRSGADFHGGSNDLAGQFRALASGDQRIVRVSYTHQDLRRDLEKGTDSAGGHTVPETFVQQLYEFLEETSAIRQTNVTVLTTSSGEKMLVPKVTARGSASWTSEGGTLDPGDPEFGQAELDAYKAGQLIQLSSELVADTGVNLLDFIARDAGRALGEKTGAAYVDGDGSSKPTGVLDDSSEGVVVTSGDYDVDDETTDIAADALIDLYHSVIRPYRRNGYWMMNDTMMAKASKLKDDNGQYLLQPSLRQSVPDQIRGRPVITDHNMPEAAADAKTVLFGDFSGYYIRDVGEMRFERSDHFAFDSDLVTFRSIMRTDGKLVDTSGAVKHLAQGSGA